MKRLLIVASLATFGLSVVPAVLAQDDSFVCNALLRHGVYDKYREIRSSASASQLQTHICEAYTKLQQDRVAGHVEGHYVLAGGEGSYSREQLEQVGQFMCADTFNSSSASSALTLIQDKISPAAMDAYRECISQNATGLKSKTIFREEDQGQVTIELRYVAPVGAPPQTTINNIVISPANAFTCEGRMWELRGQANGVGTDSVSMSCTRRVSSAPTTVDGASVLAPASTITVMTRSGPINRNFAPKLATPPPPPFNIPVGTIVAFSGTMAEAEAQKQNGWWVCDGRTVNDPLAASFNGKPLPDLSDKFLEGSNQAGNKGGAEKFTIKKNTIVTRTSGFGGTPITTHPSVTIRGMAGDETGTPITSNGPVNDLDIPTIPPFYSVIYLIRVR